MIAIYSTTSPQQAELLRTELRARGIESVLENEGGAFYVVGFPSPAVPLVVSVADAHAEEARRVLSETLSRNAPAAEVHASSRRACLSCGVQLEVAEGEDALEECPWCGRSPDRPPPAPEPRPGPPLVRSIAVLAVLTVALIGLYRWWPDGEERPAPRSDVLYRTLHDRATALGEPEDPSYDLPALCASLSREEGVPAERLAREINAGASVEELFETLLRIWIEQDPDWAMEWGLGKSPEPTVHSKTTYATIALADALALRRLRDLRREKGPTLDLLLLERRLEASVVWTSLFGHELLDPGQGLRGVQVCHALMEPEGLQPPRTLELLADRLERVPAGLAKFAARLRDPPLFWVELALDELELTREFLRDLGLAADGAPDDLRARVAAAVRQVDAALLEYQAALRPMLGSKRPVPRDPRWVRYALRSQEFHDETVQQTVASLLAEAYGSAETAERVLPAADWQSPPPMSFEAYLDQMRQAVDWSRRFTEERRMADIPSDERLPVVVAPPHLRSSTAYYQPVPFSASFRARVLVTPVEGPVATTIHGIRTVALHETYPGHHLHELWSRRSASMIRRLYPSAWLSEGWASYVERIALDADGATRQDRRDWHGRQAYLAWHCVLEACVGAGAVTEAEAVEFLRECFQYPERQARQAVGAMTRNPLSTLGYVVGEREIRRTKEDLRRSLAGRFSEKEFHERLLGFGRTPVSVVREELLRTWK